MKPIWEVKVTLECVGWKGKWDEKHDIEGDRLMAQDQLFYRGHSITKAQDRFEAVIDRTARKLLEGE